MKKHFLILFGIIFLFSNATFAEKGKKYGEGVTLKKATEISTILENPKEFVGKKVLVTGTVVGVCAHQGCWIDVAGKKEFEKIKIKVNDGEIVFPLTAKGKTIMAEGILEEIQMQPQKTTEQAMHAEHKEHKEHMEHKEGESCANCAGENKVAKVTYRIKGTGAVIQ